jgi:hypothetical protein
VGYTNLKPCFVVVCFFLRSLLHNYRFVPETTLAACSLIGQNYAQTELEIIAALRSEITCKLDATSKTKLFLTKRTQALNACTFQTDKINAQVSVKVTKSLTETLNRI